MRFRRVLLLLTLICLPRLLCAREITLLTTEYPPFSMAAKPGGGLFTQLITEAMRRKGWELKVRSVPWIRVPLELASARAAGALICWPEEIRRFDLVATRPVFISELGFFVRKNDADKINVALAGLRGMKVGAVRGYGYPPALEASAAQIDYVQDDQTNLRKLVAGRIDYVALERLVGAYLLERESPAEIRDKVVWKGPAFANLPLFVGITRQWPNAAAIVADLNEGLAAMEKDGSYQALLRAYNIEVHGLPSP
ncbi:transporter substrate-binding domain-containing protein [Pseudoduganella sp. FT93W]|uniref:Transporter substrate-binding domain-containing protein n=1 Tax=Duganella fentianensis TaxID=2692177 RepID=A0A845HWM0_9BURK|nr:transporter substrate-binding domain-containing protein [Duganella fentianensis]MYN43921.1 transporter substrate-binding domain-containing protein [Duganella fentianensis]